MPLATLGQLKAKLQIAEDDTGETAALLPVLDAAEQYVLQRTGYTLSAESVTETHLAVQPGRHIVLRKRPVTAVSAQGRPAGSPAWTSLTVDVLDAEQGIVVLPDMLASLSPVPFALPSRAPWLAWRAPVWDVVQITYTTVPLSRVPADLSDATATLAAFWYRQQLAGPAQSMTAGEVSETYSQVPVPDGVGTVLARYERRTVLWW